LATATQLNPVSNKTKQNKTFHHVLRRTLAFPLVKNVGGRQKGDQGGGRRRSPRMTKPRRWLGVEEEISAVPLESEADFDLSCRKQAAAHH
jgi:hypothetical protein